MRLSVVALAGGLFACVPTHPHWASPTAEQWAALRVALDEKRQERRRGPWAAGLRVSMREPRSGRMVDGRGAIAVAPDSAVRMVLIGAAGATVLDAWVTTTRWRVAVPPLDIVRRGGIDEPRDMPVGFLRWWFLTPLGGRLVAARYVDDEPMWLLREGSSVVELRGDARRSGRGRPCLQATRRALGRAELVEECRTSDAPSVGDSARYVDELSGLKVDLQLESIADVAPSREAFEDPDAVRKAGGT